MVKASCFIPAFLFAMIVLAGCSASKKNISNSSVSSLKETFKNDFLIGAAINAEQIEEKDTASDQVIRQQFNAVTPENIMKAEVIHPAWDKYDFNLADKLVAYAEKNNIKVNAHTLIWHSQLPVFMQKIQDAESARRYFLNHITT